jgi:hypothetical protein
LLQISSELTFQNLYSNIGTYEPATQFTYLGKTMNGNKLQIQYGFDEIAISPKIAFIQSISKIGSISIYASYHYSLKTKKVFRIRETANRMFGLLPPKSLTLSANDPSLQFSGSETNPWNNINISKLEFGISFHF